MATLPTPQELAEQAKKNAQAVSKIVKDNPQTASGQAPVVSPQGAKYSPGVKP